MLLDLVSAHLLEHYGHHGYDPRGKAQTVVTKETTTRNNPRETGRLLVSKMGMMTARGSTCTFGSQMTLLDRWHRDPSILQTWKDSGYTPSYLTQKHDCVPWQQHQIIPEPREPGSPLQVTQVPYSGEV